ncbi:MAG TPA: cob(I)yrinic acid a,c-diamide adenosyltransferase [Clostridiales bacterium]|nr:cob(I)yrinic acid a,c-diamide adenosyltransferase [Clostridiales bacterium]
MLDKGYIQIYTGDGKGKTTAALGLAVRAVGRGLKVIMIQFFKGMHTGELETAKTLAPSFKIMRYGASSKFLHQLTDKEKAILITDIKEGITRIEEIMKNRECDILIIDEAMSLIHSELISVEKVCDLIDKKPEDMELVLTGRGAPQAIVDKAHLVTEMRPIKHYIDDGVMARKGIEF